MIKKIASVFLVLVLALFGVILTINFWLPPVLAFGIHQVTGFPTKVQRTDFNLKSSKFGIYGLDIRNPKGFPRGKFVSIPEIYVDFDLVNFIKSQKIYIKELRLNIDEVGVVKNTSGESNISKLTSISKRKVQETPKEKEKLEKAKSPRELKFFVDTLVLSIRRVRFQDQTKPFIGERTIDLHIDHEVVRGLSSPLDIVRLVVLRVIYKAALGNLGVPVDLLKGQLDASLAKGQVLALESTKLAMEMGTQALGEGERFIKQAGEKLPVSNTEVEQAVDEAKAKAKSILGGAGGFLKGTVQSIEERTKSQTTSN